MSDRARAAGSRVVRPALAQHPACGWPMFLVYTAACCGLCIAAALPGM